VQGWATDDDDEAERPGDLYESIRCLACGAIHFVNPKMGKLLGEDRE
jgi:hypothetical protein